MSAKPCPTCGVPMTPEAEEKMVQSIGGLLRKASAAVAARMLLVFAVGMAVSVPLAILAFAYRMAFR